MKILVIGSGPIVIGQAAEFDYAGTQACKALREEGHEVVLINSNPATIMTDEETADRIYIEPLTPEFCERVIARERPDGILPTLGGQTGLNLASALAERGVIEKYNLKVLGTPLSAIRKAEDREEFRSLMRELNEPVPESWIVESPDQLQDVLGVVPYPCIVRPAYTLGGTGGGIANTPEELWAIGNNGLKLSMRSQIMVERSLLGWKEVEYEVMRDGKGNCITICNMENFDPMGVHTGDSIVIAPSQTLSDIEYHMLRTASLKIIRALGIEGGCNVQLAMSPESFDYYIIEVNPRVSRSSALASKATGYPIARVAAKIAVGRTLDEIENQVTGSTKACFEPALDYCVVKIPRWPFDKFESGDRTLFTQMKATGEVMAIDRSFEAAFLKAIRGLEVKQKDLWHEKFAGPWRRRPADGLAGVAPAQSPPPFSDAPIQKRQGRMLPHWRQAGATYFVTFRLHDSLPQSAMEELRAEKTWIQERQAAATVGSWQTIKHSRDRLEHLEKFLDAGHGACVLSQPAAAELVANAFKHFDGVRYELGAWVVMPNHVHVLVKPIGEHELEDILHSWKSFTAHEFAKRGFTSGQVWQSEYYDHIVRDEVELGDITQYILANPSNANLQNWPWIGVQAGGRDARGTVGETPTPRMSDSELREAIRVPTDERLWAIAEGFRRDWSVQEINKLAKVDPWFLEKVRDLVMVEQGLMNLADCVHDPSLVKAILKRGFDLGFSYDTVAKLVGVSGELVRDLQAYRQAFEGHMPHSGEDDPVKGLAAWEMKIESNPELKAAFEKFWQGRDANDPDMQAQIMAVGMIEQFSSGQVFKMVDTCAGEFESQTPYFYSTLGDAHDPPPTKKT